MPSNTEQVSLRIQVLNRLLQIFDRDVPDAFILKLADDLMAGDCILYINENIGMVCTVQA